MIIDRPVRLVFTWGWTSPGLGLAPGTSRVEVKPHPSRPRTASRPGSAWCTTGLAGDLGLLHDDGWSRFLTRLAAVIDGRDPGPPR